MKLKIRRTPDVGLKQQVKIQNELVIALARKSCIFVFFFFFFNKSNTLKYQLLLGRRQSLFDRLKKKISIKSGILFKKKKKKQQAAQEKTMPSCKVAPE